MSEIRGVGREEIPSVRGQRQRREEYPTSEVRGRGREEIPHTPKPEARGSGRERLSHAPTPEVKGGGREEQPHIQGALAVQAQEGLEELSHVEGQEGRW